MQVTIAKHCGFCPGVRNAIKMAEKVLKTHSKVYSLGPIIHNKDVVNRLAGQGLVTVENADEIDKGVVIIRSHGASPQQIQKLEEKGLEIVDATCVLVKRVQHLAKDLEQNGYFVVIVGDENHPEVQAVVGCAENVVVIGDETDLEKLPNSGKMGILCQTTQSPSHFGKMVGLIAGCSFSELKVINTLCREAIKRQSSAVELCKNVDVMFVLGGLNSANTRKLAELCKKYNSSTFHLQNWQEFDKNAGFSGTRAGITAGASTPDWIIEEFADNLKSE